MVLEAKLTHDEDPMSRGKLLLCSTFHCRCHTFTRFLECYCEVGSRKGTHETFTPFSPKIFQV